MSLLLSASLGILVAGFFACSDDTAAPPSDYGPLLQTLAKTVIVPEHDAFATTSDALVAALRDLEATPSADSLSKAQAAWRTARAAFRKLDAVHFGPIADLGISERIDLAPASATDIDALVAGSAAIDASSVSAAGGHVKGFLGLEHLLFGGTGSASDLALLQGDGAPARRRTLARAMGEEIASSAHQLADAWAPGKGGYATEIEGAGKTSARYPTQRAALDDLVGGVAYGYEVVVAVRLAAPLGRKTGGTPNPSLDPTAASDNAVADMTASLAGIHAVYDGTGLASRVRLRSAVLDDRTTQQLNDCGAKVAAVPAPFAAALTSSTASVQAAYDACKTAKGTWNTDVTSALGATLKPSDNDGD